MKTFLVEFYNSEKLKGKTLRTFRLIEANTYLEAEELAINALKTFFDFKELYDKYKVHNTL